MKLLNLAVAAGLSLSAPMQAADIYVSPTRGDDRADGTVSNPVATVGEGLKRARELRRLKSQSAQSDIKIILDSGIYRLTTPLFVRPEDSGTTTSKTIITSGGGAVISGGLEVKGWTRGTEDPRVPAALRNKIWIAEAPTVGNRILEARQLYVDGVKAERASQFAPGVMERMIDFNTTDRSITIPTPDIDLSSARQLEMYVHQRWAIAILRVKSMEKDPNGNTVVKFHDPESKLEFEHPWPQPVIGGEKGNSSFFLANALELLDQPGEWFQDYPSGRIYYYPREGQDMNKASVTAPALETLLTVSGTPERQVSNLTFENLSFEYSSWVRPSHTGHVTLQGGFPLIDAYKLQIPGLPEKAELENQAWIMRPESAITVTNARGIDFRGCNFAHLGATGLDFIAGVSDSAIEDCDFTDIGGTAIQIGTFPDNGFETHIPYIPEDPTKLCHDIKVKGNRINDVTNEDWGCVGIGAGYVADTEISGNEVTDVNYSGICVGWGWTPLESGMRNNSITGNHVRRFAKQLFDAGGIYTLSNQPGSVIRDNVIEEIGPAPYATNDRGFYIYFDEATDGFTVENNKCPDANFGYNRPGPSLKVGDNGPHIVITK